MGIDRFLIAGSGGREAMFAAKLAEDTQLYAVIGHENPLIIQCVKRSGGEYTVGNPSDPDVILDFARKHKIDYAFVNADEPLACGVVDALLKDGIKAIGGTKEATRIEWDKVYSIEMMQNKCPQFTPFYRVVSRMQDLQKTISEFESREMQIVVKPRGLTGGKGVKVMPEHLHTWEDCIDYSSKLIETDGSVLLVERLYGIEFTIMGITDGKSLVMSPASYDYPFRLEGDRGAGTGGMGCFTGPDGRLPFLTNKDLQDCKEIMQKIIDEMRDMGLSFNGVLNGGFFKTRDGIRFMEFNGRFGDPECLNILAILEGSFSELLVHICNGTLSEYHTSFDRKASVTKYLVAKEYPDHSSTATQFTIDEEAVKERGIQMIAASCVKLDGKYETLKKSRVCAFVAVSDDIADASSKINDVIDSCVSSTLEYRRDIGSVENLARLARDNSELSEPA